MKRLDRLARLAESIYNQPGKTFEAGVAEAMVAVLASPRFIFREENVAPDSGQPYALVDEYALASRLSYFLWSSMPDEELFRQAAAGTLRKNLSAQVARMLADKRADALVKNFVGQWLQARDIEIVPIEARSVLAREEKFDPQQEARRERFRELNDKPEEKLTPEEKAELADIRAAFRAQRQQPSADLTPDLRRAMRQETESVFEYVLREDRSLLELLDSDYTFLNERLARHYGITNVVGHGNAPGDAAAGQSARRHFDGRNRAGRDFKPHAHVAGQTRRVHPRQYSGHAAAAAAAEHPAAGRRHQRSDQPRADACAKRWRCTAKMPCAPPATTAWIRSGWRWKISTRWACGATRNTASRLIPPAN